MTGSRVGRMSEGQRAPLLRKATRNDIDAAAGLWMALHAEMVQGAPGFRLVADAETRFRNDFPDWVRADFRHFLVAELDTRLVGFIAAEVGFPPAVFEPEAHLFIESLYVEPDFRRSGLGRRLVRALKPLCDDLGIGTMRLGVLAGSPTARAFWSAMGAVEETLVLRMSLADGPLV